MSTPIVDVEKWILEQNPEVEHIDPDLDLFESGLLDSIQIVDLADVIDRLTPTRIDVNELDFEDLRSLAVIDRCFFASSGSPDAADR